MLSEQGIRHRKQRPCDVEPVFGNIKSNHHFKRFMLRGMKKVTTETSLLALAHNLRKKVCPELKKSSPNKQAGSIKGAKKKKYARIYN